MSYVLLVGTWWHILGTVCPTDGAGESWLLNTSGSFGSGSFWRLIGGNIGSTHLPSDCEKNCEWKSYQGQAPRTFYVTYTVSLAGSEAVKFVARRAKPVLQRYELCDLREYLSLPTMLSHFEHWED